MAATRAAVSYMSVCNSKGTSMCDQQQSKPALCAFMKQANLLCLQVRTWQCSVHLLRPKKQCCMQKVGYFWKAHTIFNQHGQDAGCWWLHQTPVNVELLGSAVASGLQWQS